MFLVAALVLALVAVPFTGGRLRVLGEVRVRFLWLVPIALGAQVAIISVWPGGSRAVHVGVHVASYVVAGAFLWVNRRLPGARLVALGFAANALVIGVNGGVMPASAKAQEMAGIQLDEGSFENSVAQPDAHLGFLGDVFAIPEPVPLANVFSVGDVLLAAGAAVFVLRTCRSDGVRRPVLDGARAGPDPT